MAITDHYMPYRDELGYSLVNDISGYGYWPEGVYVIWLDLLRQEPTHSCQRSFRGPTAYWSAAERPFLLTRQLLKRGLSL